MSRHAKYAKKATLNATRTQSGPDGLDICASRGRAPREGPVARAAAESPLRRGRRG